jgi:hypothetical protein
MDPLSTLKTEQPKEPVVAQPEVVREESVTPEVLPAIESVEQQAESVEEQSKEIPEVKPEAAPEQIPVPERVVLAAPPIIPVAPVKPVKDRLEKEIEEILEEDLKDMYLSMPKESQQEFRKKGEETLVAIRQLVHDTHKNIKKIFQLIRAWLKIIPGVNRYFLEQEAKIKTDKILFVSEEEKRRGSKL